MGHERVGTLPRSSRWLSIVRVLAREQLSDEDVQFLARKTLSLVRSRLRTVEQDAGVRAAFAFLVAMAASAKEPRLAERIARAFRLTLPTDRSAFAVVVAGRDYVDSHQDSHEYGSMAKAALGDSISEWHQSQQNQQTLFDLGGSASLWGPASTGAGFCELSRLFFARFTERYLNYFLERSASEHIHDIGLRDHFTQQLRTHIEAVSRHAFETARITQSFAAGWFNRHVPAGDVSDERVQAFLSVAFGKLRDELLRESAPQ